ncbi:MAG: beta-galactosidase [Promethearchaeota archaeon]
MSPERLLHFFGVLFFIFGQVTVILQVFVTGIGRTIIVQLLEGTLWDFNQNVINILIFLIPLVFCILDVISCIPVKGMQVSSLFVFPVLFSASFSWGGGYFTGAISGLLGLLMVGMVPYKRKSRVKRLKKSRFTFAKEIAIFGSIIAMVLPPYLVLKPMMAPYYFTPYEMYRGWNQAPNSNNTFYILPVWEDTASYLSNVSSYQQELGVGSAYVKIGFSASCWYMGEIDGQPENWTFDPDQSLYYKLNFSVNYSLPILLHMSGGDWGMDGGKDTGGTTIVSQLWADNDSNVQWDQRNNTVPAIVAETKDPLKPRLFTLSKYSQIYQYRERNIKEAGLIIKDFADTYPELFVGVSLDREVHLDDNDYSGLMNLSEDYTSYYDYNPLVIQEFQEWLSAKYGTIGALNGKFGLGFADFSHVDPPRDIPEDPRAGNAWWLEWTSFRTALVKQYVGDQARWLHDAGIRDEFIYTHQSLAPRGDVVATYARCDAIETTEVDHANAGISAYGLINPLMFEDINERSPFDWGVLEWNVEPDGETMYEYYMFMLKSMYQFGARVTCPYAWHEVLHPNLQISSNTEFKRAIRDFSGLVAGNPRATDFDGFLGLKGLSIAWLERSRDFIMGRVFCLAIPAGIFYLGFLSIVAGKHRRKTGNNGNGEVTVVKVKERPVNDPGGSGGSSS